MVGRYWRKGKIMSDVLLGIRLPKLSNNHAENVNRIHNFMGEMKSRTPSTAIGDTSRKIRELDKKINDEVYCLYDFSIDEKRIIEEATDFGRPYLRY